MNTRHSTYLGSGVLLTVALQFSGAWLSVAALITVATLSCIGAARPSLVRTAATVGLTVLGALTLSLLYDFLSDDFAIRYVWLYSAPALTPVLKFASLWAGEEGVLMLLALLLLAFAMLIRDYQSWSLRFVLILSAVLALALVYWHPLRATDAELLAQRPYQGMNAHLMSVWMAVHPPLVFGAYALLIIPTGSAVRMLCLGEGDWQSLADRFGRVGWLMLSLGLASGMWWAFEDFSFGQIWHWDPVQTSVFIVWALATAMLHGLTGYRAGAALGVVLPALSIVLASASFLAMAVTRSEVLASSHRYVGATSAPILLTLSVLFGIVGLLSVIFAIRRARRTSKRRRAGEHERLLLVVIVGFIASGTIAAILLVSAYVNATLGAPRSTILKPFFETLTRWASASELAGLRAEFAKWEVDGFLLNQALAYLMCGLFLVGVYLFARRLWPRAVAIGVSVVAAGAAIFVARVGQPLGHGYSGRGITSQHTVALLNVLDGMMTLAVLLVATTVIWMIATGRHATLIARVRVIAIGAVHAGAVLALAGAVYATVLDHYDQRQLDTDSDAFVSVGNDYAIQLHFEPPKRSKDGGRSQSDQSIDQSAPLRVVGSVALKTIDADKNRAAREGTILYRNTGAIKAMNVGPVRQLCEILDHRYARYVSKSDYLLHPFIDRDILTARQVWVAPRVAGGAAEDAPPTQALVVIRTYPFLNCLWFGLLLVALGAILSTGLTLYAPREQKAKA